jgi:hypothetical protein
VKLFEVRAKMHAALTKAFSGPTATDQHLARAIQLQETVGPLLHQLEHDPNMRLAVCAMLLETELSIMLNLPAWPVEGGV